MMKSIVYYEGAMGAYEKEVEAVARFGNGRILQWKQLLRDYKESRKQVDTIRNEAFDAAIEAIEKEREIVPLRPFVGDISIYDVRQGMDIAIKAIEELKGEGK